MEKNKSIFIMHLGFNDFKISIIYVYDIISKLLLFYLHFKI